MRTSRGTLWLTGLFFLCTEARAETAAPLQVSAIVAERCSLSTPMNNTVLAVEDVLSDYSLRCGTARGTPIATLSAERFSLAREGDEMVLTVNH